MKSQKSVLPARLVLFLFPLFLFPGNQDSIEPLPNSLSSENEQVSYIETFHSKIHFEANYGQCKESVEFVARGKGYSLFLEPTEILLLLQNFETDKTNHIRLSLKDANPKTQARGIEEQQGKSNYLIGNNPEQWCTDIPNYAKVKYEEAYSGIDLVFYGNEGELEYDFIVSPHGNPNDITLKYDSDEQVQVDKNGNLVLGSEHSKLIMRAPIAYQQKAENKEPIDAEFKLLADNSIAFEVGKYDTDLPLIIDPIIVYSTYLGGSDMDIGTAIDVDDQGCVYVTGKTLSLDFPTENAYQDELHPAMFSNITDIFVSKFSASGNSLIYSTYIGGRWDDEANGIAIDSEGRACITGRTDSDDDEETPEYEGYPMMNAYQTEPERNFSNAFATVLSASGNSLEYSSYLGGKQEDWGEDIAVDSDGNIYIVGTTFASSFPTKNAYMPSGPSYHFHAFVAKFDPYLSGEESLIYSTFLGGKGDDWGNAIAVDQHGCAYVTGQSKSADFPVTENAIQSNRMASPDAFVTKFSADGSAVEYSTYLGTESYNEGDCIEVDSEGHAYVSGSGGLGFYTTPGAFKTTTDFGSRFFSKLKTDGSGFIFSTYFPHHYSFSLDSDGQAYFISNKRQAGTSTEPFIGDANVLVLNSAGSDTLYTYAFGGSADESGIDIEVDNEGYLYILGHTKSTDFPILNAYQTVQRGETEMFITKLMPGEAEDGLTVNPDPVVFPLTMPGETSREPVDVVNSTSRKVEISNIDVEPLSLFTLEEVPDFPVSLEPGEKLEFQVAYSPGGTKSAESFKGSGAGELTIVSDADNQITVVQLMTSGIIINLTSDEADPVPNDGICDVDQGLPGNQCTLRAAIQTMNGMDQDEVTKAVFNIPGDGVPVIKVTDYLPTVNVPVHFDGSSQDAGYVIVDGADTDEGLLLHSKNSTLNSIEFQSFSKSAIELMGEGNHTVRNCKILDGEMWGIVVFSSLNTIEENVISGNQKYGVYLKGAQANENNISNNKIGTDEAGMFAHGTQGGGIGITEGGTLNNITGNTISGNKLGIALATGGSLVGSGGKSSPTYNSILDNYIGVASDGKTKIGNSSAGILFLDKKVSENVINGNVISGNTKAGIVLYGDNNKVYHNMIGTDKSGTADIGNGGSGIYINDCKDNAIEGNVIVANNKHGVHIVGREDKMPIRNKLKKNYIGIVKEHIPGILLGNSKCGIYMERGSPTISENVIAYNGEAGIKLLNCSAGSIQKNKIHDNDIGIDLYGSRPDVVLGNSISWNQTGILVDGGPDVEGDKGFVKIALNDIFQNYGDNTGVHIKNANAVISGNFFSYEYGNSITVEGTLTPSVAYNNIMVSKGYGLENLSDETMVFAQHNYWGDETGPGGSGPGEGDSVSAGVDYSNWLDSAVSIFAAAESDTILAPIGRADSLLLIIGDINYYEDYLYVSISDDMEWITSSGEFEVGTKYDSGYIDYLYFEIPEAISEGSISKVELNASSYWDDIEDFNSVFYIKAAESILEYFEISPDSVEIEVGTSLQYEATGYDQFYGMVETSSEWSCTGGSITEGLFTAGETTGDFEITAEDLATGYTATAQVRIIPKSILADVNPVELPLAKSYILKTYPNPFKGSTTINYYLDEPAVVSMNVFNLLGQEVDVLEAGYREAGEYDILWQAEGLPGGIYICKLQLSDRQSENSPIHVETRKLLLLR